MIVAIFRILTTHVADAAILLRIKNDFVKYLALSEDRIAPAESQIEDEDEDDSLEVGDEIWETKDGELVPIRYPTALHPGGDLVEN